MSESQDKTVGIKFSLDDASLSKARRGIQSLIDDVAKLVDVTSKVSFGGLGGISAKVGAASSRGGAGNVGTQMNRQAAGATGGVVDGLTRAVTASSSLFKGASAGAVGSFKIMQDSLSRMVNVSDREINRLEGGLSKLEKTFTRLQARQAAGRGGPLTAAAIEQNQQQYFAGVGQLGQANAARSAFQGNLRQMNPSLGDKVGNFMGIPTGGFQPGTNPLSMIGAVAGSPMGAIMSGVTLGMKIAMPMAAAANSYESSNLGYGLDKPMMNLQNRASIGGTFGGMAVRARGGAVSQQMALDRLMHNKEYDMIFGAGSFNSDIAKAQTEIKTGVWDNLLAGRVGGAKDAFMQKAGRFVSKNKFGGPGTVDAYGTDLTVQEIALKSRMRMASGAQAQRFGQAMANEEASDPYLNQIANDVYSGAFSDISGINASRTSGNVKYDKFGAPIMTDYDALRAKLQSRGWDPGQVFGEMSGLSDQIGRKLSGPGTATSILNMKTGGFSSAGSVYGAGSMFGGGARGGSAMTGVFQGLTGMSGKALDVAAGSQIGQLVSQEMGSGRFAGGSGTAFAAIALNAAYAGNTGAEMRNAHFMSSGLGELDKMTSGSKDALQGGLKMAAANSAAPGASWQTKRALMNLDEASLMDIAKNGSKSAAFQDLDGTGVTLEMVRSYKGKLEGTGLARVNEGMLSPEGKKVYNQWKAKGINFLKDYAPGKDREHAIRVLGSDLNTGSAEGTSVHASRMAARLLASDAGLIGGVKGRGASRTLSKHSLTYNAARDTGTNTAGVGHKKAENETGIREAGHENAGAAPLFDKTGMDGVALLGTQSLAALSTMNSSLDTMVNLLGQLVTLNGGDDRTHGAAPRNNRSIGGRGGAPGAPKTPSASP